MYIEKCPYCQKEFKKITANHLKSQHNIEYLQYLKEHKPEEYYYAYVSKWIMEFYRPVLNKFIEQVPSFKEEKYNWITKYTFSSKEEKEETLQDVMVGSLEYKQIMQKRPWYFSKNDIIEHLKLERTLGIFPYDNASHFLVFDIDIFNPKIMLSIFCALKRLGFNENEILMNWSGGKGYHLAIFFNKAILKKELRDFFDIVLIEAGWFEDNLRGNGSPLIEGRGITEQGVKLPLSLNRKETIIKCGDIRVKSSNKYCFLTDEFGKKVDTISKLESMKKVDIQRIKHIIHKYKSKPNNYFKEVESHKNEMVENKVKQLEDVVASVNIDAFNKTTEQINISIERILDIPIEPGNRNKTLLKIAVWNKTRGLSAEENEKFLIEFSGKEIHNFRTSIEENNKEIQNIMQTIYFSDKAYKYRISATIKDISYSKEDILEILSVKDEKLRKVYFAIFTHFKMYGDKHTKEFFMTYETLGKLLNLNGKDINKRLVELEKFNKIKFLRKGEKDSKGDRNLPNKYYFVYDMKESIETEKYKLFCKDNELDNVIYVNFKMTCAKILSQNEIREHFKNYKEVAKYKYQKLNEVA